MSLKERRAGRRDRRVTSTHPVVETQPRETSGEPRWHVIELGSFCHGECLDCRWRGPGRRARGSARKDAELHSLAGCGDLAQVRDLFAETEPALD